MRRILAFAAILATLAAGTLAGPATLRTSNDLIVHEWGTFTSIAGVDGRAVAWLPRPEASDLPTFVHRRSFGPKGLLRGTVRMETPVVYFYAARDMVVTATARFRNGVITEWYPRAAVTPAGGNPALTKPGFEGTIVWHDVNVVARGWKDLPVENRPSHYYAARATDASEIQIGRERDRFLFYRGVGSFIPPIVALVASDGSVRVNNVFQQSLGSIVLFEKRGDRTAYEVRHTGGSSATFAANLPVGSGQSLDAELESILVSEGLYPREAKAMIATWKDSWFEEGTRLFYVVPPETIATILPLEIEPTPAEIARVFVGRVELITSDTLRAVADAVARKDTAALQKYGRFLEEILRRLPDGAPALPY